ncbi:MAG: hypothetical protein LBU65_15650, partial [Planctomycetaceae bacterium]|nr:hypothetical protein [Planctomycetaceae bacterium]
MSLNIADEILSDGAFYQFMSWTSSAAINREVLYWVGTFGDFVNIQNGWTWELGYNEFQNGV